VRSGPGEARTILLLHIISARPSKQPLMVRTFLKVYMELGSPFLFLQEQIKDIIITSMMSHSLCTHAVMLTVSNLASTSPRFHHPFCLQARPLPSTSSSEASFSASSSAPGASCSFFLRFTFPQKMAFPTCSNPLSVQSPFFGRARLHTTQSLCVRITLSHSSRPSSPILSHKKTVGPCSLPQNLVRLYLHWGRREAPSLPTLLAAVLPKAGIVELVAASTLEIDIPSLQGAPVALLLLG
jgi:hypothetical protein